MARSPRLPADPQGEFSWMLDRRGVEAVARSMKVGSQAVREIRDGEREINGGQAERLHQSFTAYVNTQTRPQERQQLYGLLRDNRGYLLGGDPRAKTLGSRRLSGLSPSGEYVENYLGRSNLADPASGQVNPIVYITTDENGDIEIWIADETP